MKPIMVTLFAVSLLIFILRLTAQKYLTKLMGSHTLFGTPENLKAAVKELNKKGITNLRGRTEGVWAIHPLRYQMKVLKEICKRYNLELMKD